jgi:hypothetical protein
MLAAWDLPVVLGHAAISARGMPLLSVAVMLFGGLAFVALVLALVAARRAGRRGPDGSPPMPGDPRREAIVGARSREGLLTPAELSVYQVLRSLVSPRCIVFAKVRVADLFEAGSGGDRPGVASVLAACSVDFVLCEPASSVVLAGIGLDAGSDPGHGGDPCPGFTGDLFASNGLPFIRLQSGSHLDPGALRALLARHDLLPARAAPASSSASLLGETQGGVSAAPAH